METQASGYNIYASNNQPQLINNAENNILKRHECTYEGEFTTVTLLRPNKNIQEVNPHTCYTCNKSFACEQYLNQHRYRISHISKENALKNVKNIKISRYKCELCDAKFPYKKEIHRHYVKDHNSYRAHKCTICNKCYISASSLVTHSKIHNLSVNPKQIKEYSCDLYKMPFPCVVKLEEHHKQEHLKNIHGLSQSEYDVQDMKPEEITVEATSPIVDRLSASKNTSSYLIEGKNMQDLLNFPEELADIFEENTINLKQINNVHGLLTSEYDIQAMQFEENENLIKDKNMQDTLDCSEKLADISELKTINLKQIHNVHGLLTSEYDNQAMQFKETEEITVEDTPLPFDKLSEVKTINLEQSKNIHGLAKVEYDTQMIRLETTEEITAADTLQLFINEFPDDENILSYLIDDEDM